MDYLAGNVQLVIAIFELKIYIKRLDTSYLAVNLYYWFSSVRCSVCFKLSRF